MLELASINFFDQRAITSKIDGWEAGGRHYVDEEWRPDWQFQKKTLPFTIALNQYMMMEVRFKILDKRRIGPGMAGWCTLTAQHTQLVLRGRFEVKKGSQYVTAYCFSDLKIRSKPGVIYTAFNWKIKFNKAPIIVEGYTPRFKFYITYGIPRTNHREPSIASALEITEKRLSAAIKLVTRDEIFSDDIFKLVNNLIRWIPQYGFTKDINIPEKYGQPSYFGTAGIWPMMEFNRSDAECQAIIRFVMSVVNILGLPVKTEIVYIYCHPTNPSKPVMWCQKNHQVPLLAEFDKDKLKYALTSQKLKKELFSWQELSVARDMLNHDLNNFEACLALYAPDEQILLNSRHLKLPRGLSQERPILFPGGAQPHLQKKDRPYANYYTDPLKVLKLFRYLILCECSYGRQRIVRAFDIHQSRWINSFDEI